MDALGKTITPGDIIIVSDSRTTAFDIAIVKAIKPSVVYLANRYASIRKQKENTIVISEEQLIGFLTKNITENLRNGVYEIYIHKMGHIAFELNEAIQNRTRFWIRISRTLKNIPLDGYEATTEEEQEELEIFLKN